MKTFKHKLQGVTFSLGLLVPQLCFGQGTLYLSNLENLSVAGYSVDSNRQLANSFRTGNNAAGYLLNSVDLLMLSAEGTPNGFSVTIYDSAGMVPGTRIGDLIGPDPATGGVFNYTSDGIFLAPSTDYFVVLSSSNALETGNYLWSLPRSVDFESIDGWASGPYIAEQTESAWELIGTSPGGGLQFGVYATVIPEPSTLALIGGGAALLAFRWRRRRKA